ncbi:hypothetical protein R6Q59_015827 [Mikania micrantha]
MRSSSEKNRWIDLGLFWWKESYSLLDLRSGPVKIVDDNKVLPSTFEVDVVVIMLFVNYLVKRDYLTENKVMKLNLENVPYLNADYIIQ